MSPEELNEYVSIELQQLDNYISELQKETNYLRGRNADLAKENTELKQQVDELKHKYRIAENARMLAQDGLDCIPGFIQRFFGV